MNYLYSKWNVKCACQWVFTDPHITDLNMNPVEGTIYVILTPFCKKHSNILKYLLEWKHAPSSKVSVELLRELEFKEKDNTLYPNTNRFALISEGL